MARRYRRTLSGPPAGAIAGLRSLGSNIRSQARGFSGHRRRHGDGCAAGYPGAGSCDTRSVLRPRRQRGRALVGAGVRSGAGRRHPARVPSWPRAATDQYPARRRRRRRDRPALSAARRAAARRNHQFRSAGGDLQSGVAEGMRAAGRAGADAFRESRRSHGPQSAARGARAEDHVEILSSDPGAVGRQGVCIAAHAGSSPQDGPHRHPSSLRADLMQNTVHIIGAGISGLAAAVRLANANFKVHVHEATQQAGGRCRSYFDAATNLTIDNGNHLLLSGNRHALAYARSIGTEAGLVGPQRAQFPFVDLTTGQRWQIDLGDSRLPLWIFDASRRVPDTRLCDYLALSALVCAGQGRLVGDTIPCHGTLYQRLVQPLLLAALNVDPPEGSAGLAGAVVRETLLAGGQACRPLIARDGLSAVLVEPAIGLLRAKGAEIYFGHELRGFGMAADRVSELQFGDDTVAVNPADAVVMAVPPRPAAALLPGLKTPSKFRAIVNAHFRFDPPKDLPPILGVVGGLVEWLFAFPQRLSVTISSADRLVDMPREELAQAIWRDVCKAGGVQGELPPWQIVRERRATFEATPEQNALRPGPVTGWKNLFLAGDWTDTGLPATIEGSVRSGDRAADLVLAMRRA